MNGSGWTCNISTTGAFGEISKFCSRRFRLSSEESAPNNVRASEMKCFVTGASGFVGGNLVRELVRQGHSVRALLRDVSDLRGLDGLDSQHYETIRGDVLDKASLQMGLK